MADQWRAELDESSFAGRLKLVRAHEDLSVHQAARLCDLDNGSWHNWEKGGSVREKEEVIRKIVRALGCDEHWLMWGSSQSACLGGVDPMSGAVALNLFEAALPAPELSVVTSTAE